MKSGLLFLGLIFLDLWYVQSKDYKLGLLIPYRNVRQVFSNSYFAGMKYAAAITVAVRDINNRTDLLPNDTLSFEWRDTDCDEFTTLRHQIHMIQRNVTAFIGPGCQCKMAAKNAAAFNKTMISYMCNSPELSNKTEYPTFARTLAVHSKILPTVLAILDEFNWDKVAIITERKDQFLATTQYMKKEFKKNGIKLTYSAEVQDLEEYENYIVLFNDTKYEKEYENAFQQIKTKARIVILMTSYPMALEGLYLANQAGLINGDYVFIVFELDPVLAGYQANHKLKFFFLGKRMKFVIDELQAALIVTVKSSKGGRYNEFLKSLRVWQFKDPFYKVYNITQKHQPEPPVFAATLYDAVYQFAVALNKTLMYGQPVKGSVILSHLTNHSFESIRGYQVRMDHNGDAEFNLTLIHIQKAKKAMTSSMDEIASFVTSSNSSALEVKFLPDRGVEWFNGRKWPPPDQPPCGFDGKLCVINKTIKDNTNTIITAISVVLGVLAVLLIAILYR